MNNTTKMTDGETYPPTLSTWYRKYRVVLDNFAGYEAQVWRVWFPIWWQINGVNTSTSLDRAIEVCRKHSNPVVVNL